MLCCGFEHGEGCRTEVAPRSERPIEIPEGFPETDETFTVYPGGRKHEAVHIEDNENWIVHDQFFKPTALIG